MKILYICSDTGIPTLGRKGASVHVRELIAALSRMGHSVVLAAQILNKSPWELPAEIEAEVLHIEASQHLINTQRTLESFNHVLGVSNILPRELRKVLYNQEMVAALVQKFQKNPPDFIYERASLYGIAGAMLARELNIPRILELNAPLSMENTTYQNASGLGELSSQSERWGLIEAEHVVTVSSSLRDYVVAEGADAERVSVIPNGVDPRVFKPGPANQKVRSDWGLGEGPILGFVGGLRPWHGVNVLPHLLEHLLKQFKNLQMVIVGQGPLRETLEQDFKEKKLSKRVVFTGALPHKQVVGLIQEFSIALAPYPQLDHAFYFSPLKLFEYMACGIPVVASDVGQIAEVLEDNKTGLLYPPGNINALQSACDRLLSEPTLRTAMGKAASEKVHRNYTWDHNAEHVTNLAKSLILNPGDKRDN